MLLERQNTPLSLCALAIPPQFRRRVDAYRESMDVKVAQDTEPLHWSLDEAQTKGFLASLFPDERLFPTSDVASKIAEPPTMGSVLAVMDRVWQREGGKWKYFPDFSTLKAEKWEENVAEFFNDLLRHIPNSHTCTRRWTGKAANQPVSGLTGVVRKPDLLLCEEGVIKQRSDENEKFNMRTDVYAMGEVKKRYSDDNRKDSYIELAGKASFLLEVQDGRYATLGIQLLGSHIILTLFDRGGSISTHPLDIHQHPEEFLRILLGVTFSDGTTLGFDTTVSPAQNGQKRIQIIMQGKEYTIAVDTLLFLSGALHGRGTTVWSGFVTINEDPQEVVVKDSWVDPLRRYTEGRILKILEVAGVSGVPRLVHEQQVQTRHPITREMINQSTHTIRSIIGTKFPYNLRALSRLISEPRGFPIFDFTSLSELLVALVDCICAHRDALKKANILHRDISLFNLLLILAMQSDLDTSFLDRVLQEPERAQVRTKIQKLPRRGLLGDWGYAVPMDGSHSSMDPVPGIRVAGQTEPLGRKDLCDAHSIVIPVADQPLPDDANVSASLDADPLQRTGTWAWMAAELSYIGPGKPVVHRAHHDLESFFYILLAICLLYDTPGRPKSSAELAECFDPFFTVSRPSTLKTVTVQSEFGWTALIIPYISSYFQPLIPLLETIRNDLILPMKLHGKKIQANEAYTHDDFIDSIVTTLSKLPDKCWVARNKKKAPCAVPQTSSTSSVPSVTTSSTHGTFALSDNSLQRIPPIRMSETSLSGSKRRGEDESGSHVAKKRSHLGGTDATSWTEIGISNASLK